MFTYLSPSSVPGAGFGVFATNDISKNTIVTEYEGPRICSQLARTFEPQRITHIKSLGFSHEYVIDGYKYPYLSRNPRVGHGSMVNHAKRPNCGWMQRSFCDRGWSRLSPLGYETTGVRVFLKALRHIEKGEELFVNYGSRILNPHYNVQIKHTTL